MSKFKDIVGGAFVILIYAFFIYGEIFGIVHSVRKHSTGDIIASIAIPPWAWWRSVEMWWHNDYAKIDWDKRLSNDMQICVYFINQGLSAEVNTFELNNNIEEFSGKINKYPQDKFKFLMAGTRYFIEYSNSIANDFLNSLNKYNETGSFNWEQSEKSIQLETTLANFKLGEDVQHSKRAMTETIKQLEANLPLLIDIEKMDSLKNAFRLAIESQQKHFRRTFKNLFNEEL